MPLKLELPTIQNWNCHSCGGCCRQHAIEVTTDEHSRIVAQNWGPQDGIPTKRAIFVRNGRWPWSRRIRLGHQPDGACVFLDEHGLCRIHAKFGEAAKPLACRVFPYAFHPAGKQITVSLRFSCPSVVRNRGRPVTDQFTDLQALQRLVVPEGADRISAPQITPGQRLDWGDTRKLVHELDQFLSQGQHRVSVKLLRCLKFVDLVGQSRFEKVRGSRLDDYCEILREAALAESPESLLNIPEPSRAGRLQFRMLVAQYSRKDTFADHQAGWKNRLRLFRAAWQFARGSGIIPRLQNQFGEVPFADLERPMSHWPTEADEILGRYLRVKVQGLHFCGPAYYDAPFVEGFYSLALIVPSVLWIARLLAAGASRSQLVTDDVARALAIADHHQGYSPAFGQKSFRRRVRLLSLQGDVARLVAWYCR